MTLDTITDAQTYVANSGIADWEFGGFASTGDFAEWLYWNFTSFEEEIFDDLVAEYLISVGEDPDEYGLRNPNL